MTLHYPSLRRLLASSAIVAGALVGVLPGAGRAAELDDGPDVTIIAGEERTIYEYWQNGHLRQVLIVPATGKSYYLRPADPTRGQGELDQAGMLLPSWLIVEF
ncbi:MAG: DUF2782 domain-containing protein [Gammaproteobacteria bacterium]|nr:DUF2782 domain-containing protein [Gammaproteobacteria bacterium]